MLPMLFLLDSILEDSLPGQSHAPTASRSDSPEVGHSSQTRGGPGNGQMKEKLAQAHFKTLLKLHEQARCDANRYESLAHKGLGRKTERLAKAARRAETDARIEEARVVRSILDVSDGAGHVKPNIAPEYIASLVDRHRRRVTEISVDASLDTERQRPDTSLGRGAEYVGGATAVGMASGAVGAATSIPLLGDALDAWAGKGIRRELVDAGSVMADREMAEQAHDRGKAIGYGAGSIAQIGGGTAIKALDAADGLVEGGGAAITGKDIWTGKDLTGAQAFGKIVGGAAKGFGVAKGFTQDAAIADEMLDLGAKAPVSGIEQVASGLSMGKDLVDVADKTTTAVAGRSLLDPSKEKTTTERVMAGVGAAGKVGGRVAKVGSKGGVGPSGLAQVASGVSKGDKAVKAVDQGVTAATGYSISGEKGGKDAKSRGKAAKKAGKAIHGLFK